MDVSQLPAQIDARYFRTRPGKALARLISYALFEGRPLTTRGRWINPLVFLLYRIARLLPSLKSVEAPIFIVGTGRSGTTVLGKLLSVHRDVGYLNEPKALWHAACPFEDVIGSYSTGDARLALSANDMDQRIAIKLKKFYGFYLRIIGAKRVVDKYPELVFRIPFVLAAFPDAKFVFLTRNGANTCQSVEGWNARMGRHTGDEVHDWWGRDGRKWRKLLDYLKGDDSHTIDVTALQEPLSDSDRSAVEWVASMAVGLRAEQVFPGSVIRVRYEALTEQPVVTLESVCQFCNLTVDPAMLAYAVAEMHAAPEYTLPPLHPAVAAPFQRMMEQLGYANLGP